MHELPLITTIAVGFSVAWALGLLTQRLGLSPIVGYLLAGIVIGPHTPGFVGDVHIAHQLAEVGVILLMFGVGLHFHVKDLLAVKGVAVPGAIVQSLVATGCAIAIFSMLGVPVRVGAVLGMAMAVASTVVLMRVLMDADILSSPQGHVAVGWLIVEDIFTVVLLVVIPALGTGGDAHPDGAVAIWKTLGIAMLKLAALVAILMFAGSWIIPRVLVRVTRLRSRELFTLTVLVFSIAIAAGSYALFGASMALGAFLAGMVVGQSPASHQAAADALPMRDAFAVLFFISVGMLFDPGFIVRQPLMILAALGIILLVKPLTALLIVAVLGHSTRTALTVALGLAQIGEFSFILSQVAREHGLMPEEAHNVLVASAIISITLNPLLFRSLPSIEAWLRRRTVLFRLLNGRAERRAAAINRAASEVLEQKPDGRLAVVVGFGPVGRSVHRLLRDAGLSTVVIDMNMDTVSALNAEGESAIFGDASHESILAQAGLRRATHLILTLPNSADRVAIVAAGKNVNPGARILVRARYLREREDLERAGAAAAVFEEAEAAVGLARLVLTDTGVNREVAERKVRDLRFQLIMGNIRSIRTQRVRGVMVPWTRVRRLRATATRGEVLGEVVKHRFSRWPVTDPATGRAAGYLLIKDLIAGGSAAEDWSTLVRPLASIGPDDDVESTLMRMQRDGASVYLVEDAGSPIGLITIEDILEQVVGRLEDEYPHDDQVSLVGALAAGGVVLDLPAGTLEEVITRLAEAIPVDKLPPGATVAELALAREAELSTDLGLGVAVPHARCAGLAAPLVVFGRSEEGVMFSPQSPELVDLIFLLVTPLERPELQLSLLGRIAGAAGDASIRERLRRAATPIEALDIIAATERRGEDAAPG